MESREYHETTARRLDRIVAAKHKKARELIRQAHVFKGEAQKHRRDGGIMREDVELFTKRIARDGRAVEWLSGLKKGMLICPVPKDASEDCKAGYLAGREAVINLLNQWLSEHDMPGVDFGEGLNLLMQAK